MTTTKSSRRICPDCNGAGSHDPGYQGCGGQTCKTCIGEGVVSRTGKPVVRVDKCNRCNGSGSITSNCRDCTGRGWSRVQLPDEPEEMSTEDLIRKLEDAGRTGLDMSPGDELCKIAAERLRLLLERSIELLLVPKEWC